MYINQDTRNILAPVYESSLDEYLVENHRPNALAGDTASLAPLGYQLRRLALRRWLNVPQIARLVAFFEERAKQRQTGAALSHLHDQTCYGSGRLRAGKPWGFLKKEAFK